MHEPAGSDPHWANNILRRRRWDSQHLADMQKEQRAGREARRLVADAAATCPQGCIDSDPDEAHWRTAARCLVAMSDVSVALRSRLLLCSPGGHDDLDFEFITRDIRNIEDSILSLRYHAKIHCPSREQRRFILHGTASPCRAPLLEACSQRNAFVRFTARSLHPQRT